MSAAGAMVGSLGATRLARVDPRGLVGFDGSTVTLDWWIGADDRWHRAGTEVAVRQRRLDATPAYETAMRIPDGDAVQRVYAVGGSDAAVVIEIENSSAGPVALALVVRGLRPGTRLDAVQIPLDRSTALWAPKPAAHAVAAADDTALLAALERGDALHETPGAVAGPGSVVALLQPLAHRTRARYLVRFGAAKAAIDVVGAPSLDDVAEGWSAMLRRGMQVVLADPDAQLAVDRARVDVLLEAGRPGARAEVFTTLEEWGFDREATAVWKRLGWRARRRATRRRTASTAVPAASWAAALSAARDALISESDAGVVSLLPVAPEQGAPVEVHDAPTRAGTVSYAVRWHGERAALLWDVRDASGPVRLVAPGLDPDWSTDVPAGEVLLGPSGVRATGG